jgi:PhnB protein
MAKINLYINFNGMAEDAFKFYKSVFGGEFIGLQRFKDTPAVENLPTEDGDKLMHVSLPLGENLLLHGTDMLESRGQNLVAGNNFNIMIEAASKAEAEQYFSKLSAGGKDISALREEFWGAYFGSFTDKFGIQWMVNYQFKPL